MLGLNAHVKNAIQSGLIAETTAFESLQLVFWFALAFESVLLSHFSRFSRISQLENVPK